MATAAPRRGQHGLVNGDLDRVLAHLATEQPDPRLTAWAAGAHPYPVFLPPIGAPTELTPA